jgi:hypothetical protein
MGHFHPTLEFAIAPNWIPDFENCNPFANELKLLDRVTLFPFKGSMVDLFVVDLVKDQNIWPANVKERSGPKSNGLNVYILYFKNNIAELDCKRVIRPWAISTPHWSLLLGLCHIEFASAGRPIRSASVGRCSRTHA